MNSSIIGVHERKFQKIMEFIYLVFASRKQNARNASATMRTCSANRCHQMEVPNGTWCRCVYLSPLASHINHQNVTNHCNKCKEINRNSPIYRNFGGLEYSAVMLHAFVRICAHKLNKSFSIPHKKTNYKHLRGEARNLIDFLLHFGTSARIFHSSLGWRSWTKRLPRCATLYRKQHGRPNTERRNEEKKYRLTIC